MMSSPIHIKVIIHPKGVFIIKRGCGEHSLLNILLCGARGAGWGVEKSNWQTKPPAPDGNYCNIYSSYKFHPYSD